MVRPLIDGGPVQTVVLACEAPPFRWIDVGAPDRAMLRSLVAEYGVPESAIQDFVDPLQLPKHEREGRDAFMILRAHVDPVPASAASARELTQPIAIFTSPGLVLTLHQREHRGLARLRARYTEAGETAWNDPAAWVLDDVVREVLQTFTQPLATVFEDLSRLEDTLLRSQLTESTLERLFIRRRRASALVTLLRRTREVVARVRAQTNRIETDAEDIAELVDSLEYRAHELVEHTDHLINLQISIAAHRTNEIIRVLTLISVVFMPLTFVVGLYGMNFDMPEFHVENGFLIAYVLCAVTIGAALLWFRRRGWLG